MLPVDPETLPPELNFLIFILAAGIVWQAGTRMSRYADIFAARTGIGKAFIGALLLGGMTSLPEGVTTVTASAIGNAPLAVNNLFGGIAMQVAILGLADLIHHRSAIPERIHDTSVVLQAAMLILVLTLGAAGIIVGDVLVLEIGLWTAAILVVTIGSFYLIHLAGTRKEFSGPENDEPRRQQDAELSNFGLTVRLALGAAAIFVGGIVLANTGDALAVQTGLGSAFIGAVLVAISTSLPEISTTLGALRIGAYEMASSNIFGANLLDMSILFLADVVYPGEPVLNLVGRFSVAAALLGTILTTVYLIGLLWKSQHDRSFGLGSIVLLVLYIAGLVVLYHLR